MGQKSISDGHTCAQGEIFLTPPPPSSAAEKKKEEGKFGGEAVKFFTFSAAMMTKIGRFRLFFAKMALSPPPNMAEFTAIRRTFSYITFFPPWQLLPCTCMLMVESKTYDFIYFFNLKLSRFKSVDDITVVTLSHLHPKLMIINSN